MSTNAPTQTFTDVSGDFYDHLVDCYVECDDLPIAMAMQEEPIKVDDQNDGDVTMHFCKIEVMTSDDVPNQFELRLTNSPISDELDEAIDQYGAADNYNQYHTRADIVITTSIKDVTYLRNLAKAYRRMTGRGADYPDPNWKWVCRRTADSLDRLATNIREFRRGRNR